LIDFGVTSAIQIQGVGDGVVVLLGMVMDNFVGAIEKLKPIEFLIHYFMGLYQMVK